MPAVHVGLGLGKERDALVIELQWMVDGVSEQVGSLTAGRHPDHVVTGSVARAVMCTDTRRELGGCRAEETKHSRGPGDLKPPPAHELAGRGGGRRHLPLDGTAHDHRIGKEQDTARGDPPDMVGVQMSEEDGADVGRRDTGCSQRTGQQPSCGNRLRRICEPGRDGNIAGERDAGRLEARIHQDDQVLCLNQEAVARS